jgi:hypothetical protein
MTNVSSGRGKAHGRRSAAFEEWVARARAVPVEGIVGRRGIRLEAEGKDFRGACVLCGEGTDRFEVTPKKNGGADVWRCRKCGEGGDGIKLTMLIDGVDFTSACTELAGCPPPQEPRTRKKVAAAYEYRDEAGELRLVVERVEFEKPDGTFVLKDGKRDKKFRQKQPDPNEPSGWSWNAKGVPALPYRLPELIEAAANNHAVIIVEGEKKADLLWSWNVPATCCPMGAEKWRAEHSAFLRGASVVILPDNDDKGRKHANAVGRSLQGVAASVRMLELPGLPAKGDVMDWADAGGTAAMLHELIERNAKIWEPMPESSGDPDVSLEDFRAYMPLHAYIYTPAGEMWPVASVNSRFQNVDGMKANLWLDKNRPVEQMTWAPGLPMLIPDKLISEGGWIEHRGVTCFNLYRPPKAHQGNAAEAGPWLEHVRKIYGDAADRITMWLAHRVQRPGEKINHALFLGGNQGVGKDTLLEPVKHAVGPWNFIEVGPTQLLGRFNGFLKAVVLRVSEAHDLGDANRFQLYDRMKAYTAAPPDVLRVDEKYMREHSVVNCCGVIITSNHKLDGIYLTADDRRHLVEWSDLTKDDFDADYWIKLWAFYAAGGLDHVAAYLAALDISNFNPKAPPPKTDAFWDIVDASRAPEDAELADIIDAMKNPDVMLLAWIIERAPNGLADWITDRRNRRAIPHRLQECGYVPVRNDGAKDGMWAVNGHRQAVYGKAALPLRDRITAARILVVDEDAKARRAAAELFDPPI